MSDTSQDRQRSRIHRQRTALILTLNGAFALVVLYFLSKGFSSPMPGQALEYKDFISIVLSALAVILAALTLFVGVAAVWGFTALRDEAGRIATEAAREVAREVATKLTREIVEPIAARAVMDARPSDTSEQDAAAIAAAEVQGDGAE